MCRLELAGGSVDRCGRRLPGCICRLGTNRHSPCRDLRRGGRRTATKTRRKSTPPDKKSTKTKEPARRGIFFRLINFIREVVAELRKVIWPTRKELITYTAVVVVFVSIMLTIVGSLDYGFAKVVLWVFGNKTTPTSGP